MASPDAVLVFNGSQIGLISNGDGTYALQTSGSGASGGGTEYTEDAAAAVNPVGGALILVRRDTLSAAEVSANGDNIAAGATSRGEVYVFVDPRAGTIAKAEDVASADGDVGVPAMAVRKATPASTSGTDGDYEMLQMSGGRLWVSGVVTSAVQPVASATASVTSVAGSATSVQLLASNAARTGFRAFNDSSAVCYVKYGTTASTSNYTVQLLPGGYLEESQYSGRVDGIWASATGAMKLTELS